MTGDRRRQLALRFPALRRCTLANFESGPNSELVSALHAVGQSGMFAALWLVGEHGAGKSHLLQGACHAAVAAGLTAAYVSPAVHAAGPEVFEGLGDFALVALDDVERWLGPRHAEEALLALYQQLFDRQGTLVLASERAPADIEIGLADLGSRLRAAQVYRLRVLEDADRARVIERLALQRGLELPGDVAAFILRRVPRRMDELLAVFEKLDRGALAQQRRLTIPLAKELLGL